MSSPLLIRTLEANAVFSAVSGVALIALAIAGTDGFGVSPWMLGIVGAGLVPFAWIVHRTARKPEPMLVRLIIGADVAWVVAAAVILLGFPGTLSPTGSIALALASLVVADLAVMQYVGMRRGSLDTNRAALG
jgi:hypothetical protein